MVKNYFVLIFSVSLWLLSLLILLLLLFY